MSARILLTSEGGVATVTLNAPERGNSLDAPMLADLEQILLGLATDPGLRVALLRGAGPRAFSTGYHVPSLLAELAAGQSVSDFEGHPLERALRALEAVPVPTVAVVGGHAYGAGCELALTCDLRVAAEEARLCMPPAKLGVLYSATGIRRLRDLVGPALCQELLYTGDVVCGARALAVGLVNRLVPRADLDAAAEALARSIADNSALSIRHTKTILREVLVPAPLAQSALAEVAQLREECFRSEDFLTRARRLGKR